MPADSRMPEAPRPACRLVNDCWELKLDVASSMLDAELGSSSLRVVDHLSEVSSDLMHAGGCLSLLRLRAQLPLVPLRTREKALCVSIKHRLLCE